MRILYVSFVSPWPPTSGISQRTNLIHRSLSEHGDVDTLALVDEQSLKPGAMKRLRDDFGLIRCVRNLDRAEHGNWKYLRLVNKSLAEKLAHNLGRWDVIYGTDPNANAAFEAALHERSYDLVVGRYLISLTKAGALGRLPTILDVDDLDTELYRSRLRVPGTPAWKKWILRHHLSQMERIIPAKLAQCDAHWIASESDRARPGMEQARLLPNIPFDVAAPLPGRPSPTNQTAARFSSSPRCPMAPTFTPPTFSSPKSGHAYGQRYPMPSFT